MENNTEYIGQIPTDLRICILEDKVKMLEQQIDGLELIIEDLQKLNSKLEWEVIS